MNTSPLDERLSDLRDRDLLGLIAELDHVTGLRYRNSDALPLQPYLVLCLYPQGAGTKRKSLDSKCAPPGFLTTRLDRISSESIQLLCQDLAVRAGEGIEMHASHKLLTFLNSVLRKLTNQRKKRRR